jgi:hypothetical protein
MLRGDSTVDRWSRRSALLAGVRRLAAAVRSEAGVSV